MTSGERGYVLFRCEREPAPPPTGALVQSLLDWRARLHRLGLIGVYPDGIGFGNLSFRIPRSDRFVISGTNTGRFPVLTAEHLTLVTSYDFARNRLACRGPVDASSESLSHAAVYLADPQAEAVVHVHHGSLWSSVVDRLPTTERTALAGTPEMARAIESLVGTGRTREEGLIVMGGHPEGVIAYGRDVQEAGQRILRAMRLDRI
jgi:L-ribulose-5-phosphate 4-epimerase